MTTLPHIPPRLAFPSETRAGWIGTGVMGAPLCRHVQQARYRITLHTRTPAKAASILAQGATWADSPRVVAEETDVVFTLLGFPQDVRAVYFGERGLLAGARPGMILVDMTTTEPSLSREIAAAADAGEFGPSMRRCQEAMSERETPRYRS
jgi:3-hydroxyisobutyrate dehydrogenase